SRSCMATIPITDLRYLYPKIALSRDSHTRYALGTHSAREGCFGGKDTTMGWQSGLTRRALLSDTAAAGTVALATGVTGAFAQPAPKQPNIIFTLADDLGYADVSCYGRRDFTTPNIDRIAARGMRFLQGYANSAVCSATRLALISGRYQ